MFMFTLISSESVRACSTVGKGTHYEEPHVQTIDIFATQDPEASMVDSSSFVSLDLHAQTSSELTYAMQTWIQDSDLSKVKTQDQDLAEQKAK